MLRLTTIADACEIVTDGTHYTPKDIGNGYPFLTVKDVSDVGLDFDSCSFISEQDFKDADAGNSSPKKGDVLFSKDGTVGKVHVVNTDKKFAVLSSLAILRPKHGIVDAQYLGHALRSPAVLGEALKKKTGTAIRRIILSDLKKVKFPLPNLKDQQRIVSILDQADVLRAKRREALAQLDTLANSIFIEMFGDPITNPNGWLQKNLKEVATLINGRAFKPEEWEEDGLPIIRIQNLNDGNKSYNYTTQILPEKFKVSPNEILFSWSGTPGTSFGCFRWRGGEGWLNQHIFKVVLDDKCLDGDFFIQQMNLKLGELISQAHGGVGLQHVTKGMVDNTMLLLPPISLQKKYSERLQAVHKLESLGKRSQSDLDRLIASIQELAFEGSL